MVFTTKPRNVSTLGLIRAKASQRTMASSRTPQARPKALVQVLLDPVRSGPVRFDPVRFDPVRLAPVWLIIIWLLYLASGCSWIVVRLRISISRLPLGVTTAAVSPTFLFSRARPIGELVEILPAVTSDSSLVTSLYSTSAFLELSYTRTC